MFSFHNGKIQIIYNPIPTNLFIVTAMNLLKFISLSSSGYQLSIVMHVGLYIAYIVLTSNNSWHKLCQCRLSINAFDIII